MTKFLRRKALAVDHDRRAAEAEAQHPGPGPGPPDVERPWFAVASFTNPHDIATYPVTVRQLVDHKVAEGAVLGPLDIPAGGTLSAPPEDGTWRIPLNPGDLLQENANPSPSQNEDLKKNKPDCQFDYSLKLGLALTSKTTYEKIIESPSVLGLPFQLTDQPELWAIRFAQYYTYVHHVVDQHIERVLKTLEETGLWDNTIVVFASDHGEYAAAHGMMMQKWHTGYQEAIHVPLVVSSPLVNDSDEMRQVEALTSHIDLLPTVLGLAGIGPDVRKKLKEQLRIDHDVPEPVGADLSPVILGTSGRVVEPDGTDREGILFATDDMVTEPLPFIGDPHSTQNEENYGYYLEAIEWYREEPHPDHPEWKPLTDQLKPGSVCQPCHVRCVRTERFKLVRYCDLSSDDPVPDQWEMYDREHDPNEMTNLLVYDAKLFPKPIESPPPGLDREQIVAEAKKLSNLLAELEAKMLAPGGYE